MQRPRLKMHLLKYFTYFALFIGNCVKLSKGRTQPTMVMEPRLDGVVKGETVILNCTIPAPCSGGWVSLHKNNETKYREKLRSLSKQCSVAFQIQANETESFTCAYAAPESGQWKKYPRSDPVTINIIDRPKTPSLYLNGSFDVLLKGERAKMICEVSSKYSCSRMHFFRDGEEVYNKSTLNNGHNRTAAYTIAATSSENYSCHCAILISGNWLISEQSGWIWLTVIDRLAQPEIRLNESANIFVKGDSFHVSCGAGDQHSVNGFSIYKGSDGHLLQRQRNIGLNVVTFRILASTTEEYWCLYEVEILGRLIDSAKSTTVRVSVIDRPKKPGIFLNSNVTTLLTGELVSLTCAAPLPVLNATFHLYTVSNSLLATPVMVVEGIGRVTFNLTGITNIGTGHYRCMYNSVKSGGRFDSEQSDPVNLTVIDRPLKPKLSIERQNSAIMNGGNITLNCTAPNAYPALEFHFYENFERHFRLAEATEGQQSASITVKAPPVKQSTEYYTCRYLVDFAGRRIYSDTSKPQRLVFSDRFKGQLAYSLGFGLVLFLLIVVLICILETTRRARRRQQCLNLQEDSESTVPVYAVVKKLNRRILENDEPPYNMIGLTDINADSKPRLTRCQSSIYASIK